LNTKNKHFQEIDLITLVRSYIVKIAHDIYCNSGTRRLLQASHKYEMDIQTNTLTYIHNGY